MCLVILFDFIKLNKDLHLLINSIRFHFYLILLLGILLDFDCLNARVMHIANFLLIRLVSNILR